MRKYKKELIEVSRLESIKCDCCGETFDRKEKCVDFDQVLHISDTGGYASLFGDGNTWEVDLCESCVQKLFGQYIRITGNVITD